MRLVRVEVRRLFARRLTWVSVLVLLLLIGLLIASNVLNARGTYTFIVSAPILIRISAALLAMFTLVVGASFIGAEWHHGTMSGLLTWEPRRLKVFGSKLAGLWIGSAAIGLLVFGLALATNFLLARRFGQVGPLTAGFQEALLMTTARGLALALVGGAVGFAIAYATRLSSAALGVGLGYAVIGEIGLRLVDQRAERWLVSNNVAAWLNGSTTVPSADCATCAQQATQLTMWQGGIYLGAIALALLIVSAALFSRRDVT